jgi:hypothetical protein
MKKTSSMIGQTSFIMEKGSFPANQASSATKKISSIINQTSFAMEKVLLWKMEIVRPTKPFPSLKREVPRLKRQN